MAAKPQRYVALFRGINVGKAKRIAMADLRELLTGLGYGRVETLLNSGNACFDASGRAAQHGERIRQAVLETLGVDAAVLVKSAAEIDAAIQGLPMKAEAEADPSHLLVALIEDAKALQALQPLLARDWGVEQLRQVGDCAYLSCPVGINDSPLALALSKALRSGVTTRNWSTLLKIRQALSA
ncbi:DUF1697 domain-containing protein [Pelomonas sp. SE-A7]|uniref:DUF1697 domain-containing protein n=1 Tax=Pelomonas sp. SE-A7 TaxID=3054953 RepID=UPI00259C8CE4|nr:DUF1697 domain-containing protein [Pelomonas sp. SE-A7]MDM4768206.1 DUF1697 domain-containing protein [Pelomonas sp. SE-A7]